MPHRTLALFLLNIVLIGALSSQAERPNIVILFADDLGYSDIGCYGGEIETPNLDRLAAEGVRFTQFYNTSRCCPSRASLLTGLYSHEAGIGMMVYKDFGIGYRENINDRCVTFGEVLKAAGYQTMMTGKWHVGHKDPKARPEVRGFDKFTGIYSHIDSYWKVLKNCPVYKDQVLIIEPQESPTNPYHPEEAFYTTDYFTDAALDYIEQAAADDSKPFLLYVAYNAPHFPLETPEHLTEKYRGRYMKGWDVLRREKLERMKAMGLVPETQRLPDVVGFDREKIEGFGNVGVDTGPLPKWDTLSNEDKEELDFRRAMYAGQVDRMDWNIGRIIERLKETGEYENTVILFLSDNGCSGELDLFGMNWDTYKSSNYDEWRKKGGWSISQGQCWASYSNTPFRKYKKFVHEGGIATPFFVHWPAGIKDTGRIVSEFFFHLIDIMPTLCDLADVDYPKEFNGNRIKPSEGVSMLPYLLGKETETSDRSIYWQHENHSAIRAGDWKLVTNNDRSDDPWELYNFSEDRSESNNLASQYPDIAKELHSRWKQWARDVNALPFPEDR
ncbi:MAG: arylsulfatase [Bacteroidetes bacterium]|nr:arylsulfatase [Bacteroidota bacterium]